MWTLEGWLYVAVVIDLFSRQVVGWAVDDHMRTSLCIRALQPLVNRLTWHLLQGYTLHAYETLVAQLEPGRGKTRKAYLWAYRSNDLNSGPRI